MSATPTTLTATTWRWSSDEVADALSDCYRCPGDYTLVAERPASDGYWPGGDRPLPIVRFGALARRIGLAGGYDPCQVLDVLRSKPDSVLWQERASTEVGCAGLLFGPLADDGTDPFSYPREPRRGESNRTPARVAAEWANTLRRECTEDVVAHVLHALTLDDWLPAQYPFAASAADWQARFMLGALGWRVAGRNLEAAVTTVLAEGDDPRTTVARIVALVDETPAVVASGV